MSSRGLSIDRYVDVHSPVHRADARLKCGATVVFIVAVTSLPVAGWSYLGAFCACAWLLALASRIGLVRTFMHSLIAVPFLAVAVPTVFTFEGRSLQSWDLGLLTLTPTYEGLAFVATILWKGWVAVTASVVLASTTRYLDIVAALRWFRVPALLVAVLEMMYRYVFLLGAEARRMLEARRSRSAALPGLSSGGTVSWRARVTGQMAGSLFVRTLNRAERVHMAMASRGYDGIAVLSTLRRLTLAEMVIFISISTGLVAAAVAARVV